MAEAVRKRSKTKKPPKIKCSEKTEVQSQVQEIPPLVENDIVDVSAVKIIESAVQEGNVEHVFVEKPNSPKLETIPEAQFDAKEANVELTLTEDTVKFTTILPEICQDVNPTQGTYSGLITQVQRLRMEIEQSDEIASSEGILAKNEIENTVSSAPEPEENVRKLSRELDPKLVHRKIAHAQAALREMSCQTLSREQLESLYRNPELEANEEFITSFIEARSDSSNHEFRELLLGYLRARVRLMSTVKDLEELEKVASLTSCNLWEERQHTITEKGKCRDGAMVSATHRYVMAVFDLKSVGELKHTLMELRDKLHEEFCFHAYSSQVARLQIESYIHRLLKSVPELGNMQPNILIHAYASDSRPIHLTDHAGKLKICVGILFSMQRRPAKDGQFVNDTRIWLSKLVAVLIRVATFEDHLFILNHVLRCPAGVSKWGKNFIQIPRFPVIWTNQLSGFGCPVLDHAITVLATILQPIRDRDKFLLCLNTTIEEDSAGNESSVWVLLDSDGEEDDDPGKCWLHWQENDLVSFLNQIPFGEMYKYVLGVQSSDEVNAYNMSTVTGRDFYRLIAFSTCVIKILKRGLCTFSLVRYKQFNKRICQLIRHAVMYVSDHWEIYQAVNPNPEDSTLARLQAEFDQFFLRATCSIFSSQRLGAWQFMAAMPFRCISVKMLWKILWFLHTGCKAVDIALLEQDVNEFCWQDKCRDPHVKLEFEEILSQLPDCEAYYLVTTLTNIAGSKELMEPQLVEFIAKEVYQISYLHCTLRHSCAKWGRELLANICNKHVFVISVLLEEVKKTIAQIGMVSIYLFLELPVDLWRPSEMDLRIIESWLLKREISSCENQFARAVLSSMNWDTDDSSDYLFLELETHYRVGLLIVEATRVHLCKNQQGLMSKGFQQITNLATTMKSAANPEHVFIEWAWDMMRTLRLHLLHLPDIMAKQCLLSWESATSHISDFHEDKNFLTIKNGVEEKQTLALYAALVMTTAGHSVAGFCQNLELLNSLVENQSYEAALRALCSITVLFLDKSQYLSTNSRFLGIINAVLAADLTYMRAVKNLVLDGFPGKVLTDFANMIDFQLFRALHLGFTPGLVAHFWITIITSIGKWESNRSALFILDTILQAIAFDSGCSRATEIFAERLKETQPKSGNAISTFFSWMLTGSLAEPPTLLNKQFESEFHWYTYFILEIESECEERIGLWGKVQTELAKCPSATVDTALKRAVNGGDGTSVPAQHLSLYRWAWACLKVPFDHPLLVLYWQKFFSLFLQRAPQNSGHRIGSVGERFFDGTKNLSLMKMMKRRLQEIVKYCTDLISKLKNCSPSLSYSEEKLLFTERLATLIRTFSLWLEEPRLHEPNLHLPSLLLPYDPTRLALIFQNSKDPWMDFVDLCKVRDDRTNRVKKWDTRTPKRKHSPEQNTKTPVENALSRLKSYEETVPPPDIPTLQCAVPTLPNNVLNNSKSALTSLKLHLDILVLNSKAHFQRIAAHQAIDDLFLQLAPQLYANISTEIILHVPCQKKHNKDGETAECTGPGHFKIKFKERRLKESVSHQLDQNRTDWKSVVEETKLLPKQTVCIATVFLENAVMHLLESNAKSPNNKNLREIGQAIFYHLSGLIDEAIESYPPCRHFFSSSIEVLGQEFVNNDGAQCERLLDIILKHPQWVGWLAHLFCPNAAISEIFIKLYSLISITHRSRTPDLAFVMLTKFDIAGWLINSKPKFSEVSSLIEISGHALKDMGIGVTQELLMLHEIYRQHLRTMCLHQFPDHFGDVFRLLLNGSDSQNLSVEVWRDIISALIPNDSWKCELLNEERAKIFVRYAQQQTAFSTQQFQETLQILKRHFMDRRFRTKDSAHYGLYTIYKPYIREISIFMEVIAFGYVVSIKQNIQGTIPDEVLMNIWNTIWGVYQPWMEPFTHDGCIVMPWMVGEENSAAIITSGLAQILRYSQGSLYTNNPILALLLDCYARTYVNQTVRNHVLTVVHAAFAELPWSNFWPDITSVGKMVSISYCGLEECVSFLASVFIQINWPQLVQHYLQTYMTSLVTDLHVCLLNLLVMLSYQPVFQKSKNVLPLLEAAHVFQWQLINCQMFEAALGSFVSLCNPFFILEDGEETQMQRDIMSLLQAVSGFVPAVLELNSDTRAKCVNFIRANSQLLCTCASRDSKKLKESSETAKKFIQTLVRHAEVVTVTGSSAATHFAHSVEYLNEVFTVLNVTASVTLQDVTITALQEWALDNSNSPIMASCLNVITSRLASYRHVAVLMETFVESYFSVAHEELDVEAGWSLVFSSVSIPETVLSDVTTQCVACESYLSLYTFVSQKHHKCQNLDEEMRVLQQLANIISGLKPTECNEAKLLLLLGKTLDMSSRQLIYGGNVAEVAKLLQQVGSAFMTMGDERTSSGFLSVIGLGKRSQLSARFRLAAKATSAFVMSRASTFPSGSTVSGKTVTAAVQSLESVANHKQYQAIRGKVEHICNLVRDESVGLGNYNTLLKYISQELFPDKLFLKILQVRPA